jgi:hypothetical protein
MKHEAAWGHRAGNPSWRQLEVAVMAVRFDIRSALRSDRPKHRRASLRASVARTNGATMSEGLYSFQGSS